MEKFKGQNFSRKWKSVSKIVKDPLISHLIDCEICEEIDDIPHLRTEAITLKWISTELQSYIEANYSDTPSKYHNATKKLSRFVNSLGDVFNRSEHTIHIDEFIEDSIVLKFPHKSDLRINLYFNEDLEYESEECYLSYKRNGMRIVESNNISNIAKLLKTLL